MVCDDTLSGKLIEEEKKVLDCRDITEDCSEEQLTQLFRQAESVQCVGKEAISFGKNHGLHESSKIKNIPFGFILR